MDPTAVGVPTSCGGQTEWWVLK